MKSRALLLPAALLLCLPLAACNDDNGGNNNGGASAKPSGSASATQKENHLARAKSDDAFKADKDIKGTLEQAGDHCWSLKGMEGTPAIIFATGTNERDGGVELPNGQVLKAGERIIGNGGVQGGDDAKGMASNDKVEDPSGCLKGKANTITLGKNIQRGPAEAVPPAAAQSASASKS